MKKTRKSLNSGGSEPLSANFFPPPKQIIDQAYIAQRKASVARKKFRDQTTRARTINSVRGKAFATYVYVTISGLSKKFPRIDELEPFYVELLNAIVDVERLKKNLSLLNNSALVVKKIRADYSARIFSSKSIEEANSHLKSLEGRICSVVNRLDRPISQLKVESKKLRELPTIDFKSPIIVLAGFPNVGKTTLLHRLTGSKANIAPYQFTTKQINVGVTEYKYQRVQILDTPGLLDKKKHSDVEKKAIAALKHLSAVIVFMIDPTGASGFSVEEQFSLLGHVRSEFRGKKIIVVLNKADAATKEEIESVTQKEPQTIIDGEQTKGEFVRAEIGKALKA
ncbi:MAG: 50S ribosome-binding GTPase [archaeon]|nr:50S ribosome-binding GTPase [archaeon]